MPPFIDQTTFKSYCLSGQHYNSSYFLFKVLGKVLEKDTEGLYFGVRTHPAGFKSYVYVGETELKKTWFYLRSGVRTTPNDNNVSSVNVFFIYEGVEFQLRGRNELNLPAMGIGLGGHPTHYPTHDRKIGCVPKK